MKAKEVTIYDIAERLQIAPSTVSRGLKGHYTVSLKTQRIIAATAEEMGYQSNMFAVGLRTKKTSTIGLIIPRINSDFMASVIAGIEKVVNDAGYTLIITQSLESKEKEIRNAKTLFAQRVDGLLVSLSEDTGDINHFDIFRQKHIPLLFFDRSPDEESLPSVVIDNEEAGYLITSHLIAEGARKIVHLSTSQKIGAYSKRYEGYLRALKEHHLESKSCLVILENLTEESGIKIAQQIKELGPDAVFAANDVLAAACMNQLINSGIKVPDDILIAGFNNDIISRNVSPALTTVDYPGFEMGELAARNLLEHLVSKRLAGTTSTTILPSSLIIRNSTTSSR